MLYILSCSADQSGELRVTTHLLSVLTQLASLGPGLWRPRFTTCCETCAFFATSLGHSRGGPARRGGLWEAVARL